MRSHRAGDLARRAVRGTLAGPLDRAARRYVLGPDVTGPAQVAERLAERGVRCTFAYWDAPGEDPDGVLDRYEDALAALPPDGYLSVKLPALDFTAGRVERLLDHPALAGRRVHLDALAIDTVDRTFAVLADVHARRADAALGYTLPGRWRRSVVDAGAAGELGLTVRVVKGQWADPADPGRDLRRGYLEVVDALAGQAPAVAVATHDVPLMTEAVRRLRAAGTACEVELLHGLPVRASLAAAARLGVPVRMYLPFGQAYLPYALSQLARHPRMLAWLARDMIGGVIHAAGGVIRRPGRRPAARAATP